MIRRDKYPIDLPGNRPLVSVAQTGRRFDQRLQHCLEVEGRAADDLEPVGGGGLLLQGLRKIVCALPQLIEQSRVLDGDDRLAGKILKLRNLPVRKGPNLLSVNGNRADKRALLEHWDDKERANTSNFGRRDCHRMAFNSIRILFGEIGDMHHLFRSSHSQDGSVLAYLAAALS
jgi:hypothetical protein